MELAQPRLLPGVLIAMSVFSFSFTPVAMSSPFTEITIYIIFCCSLHRVCVGASCTGIFVKPTALSWKLLPWQLLIQMNMSACGFCNHCRFPQIWEQKVQFSNQYRDGMNVTHGTAGYLLIPQGDFRKKILPMKQMKWHFLLCKEYKCHFFISLRLEILVFAAAADCEPSIICSSLGAVLSRMAFLWE